MLKLPKLSAILSFFTLLLFAVAAHSQGTATTSVRVGEATENGQGSGSGSGGGVITGFVGSIGPSAQKGRPFSADVIDEDDKYLADGNHIHRESHGKVFRDSEGRSRNEMEIGAMVTGGTPWVHVTIFDPVQNVFILLDPQRKIASVSHFNANFGALNQLRAPQPAGGAAQTPARPASPVGQRLVQNMSEAQGPRPMNRRSREDLGTTEIEGFTVKGTRISTTIPAGAKGNDQPMITTTERWFSEDLKTDLITKSNSPESGQHTHKLVNIHSGDPDPLLFQAPADYTVKENSQQ